MKGPRVELVPVAPEHRERLDELRGRAEVVEWWQDPQEGWLADEPDTFKYAILLEGDVIGYAQWYEDTDPMFRHAGLDLFLDPAVHGRGRGFHRLVIDPEVANEVAIACYRKVGFKPVGVMRRYQRDRFGEWKDGLLMDLLADELVRD